MKFDSQADSLAAQKRRGSTQNYWLVVIDRVKSAPELRLYPLLALLLLAIFLIDLQTVASLPVHILYLTGLLACINGHKFVSFYYAFISGSLILIALLLIDQESVSFSYELTSRLFTILILVLFSFVIFRFKKLTDQVLHQNCQLERKRHELDRIIYVASHNLQEPLANITSLTHRINKKFAELLPETSQRYLDHLNISAGKMRDLVHDLMNHSRLDNDETPVKVDINNTLSDAILELDNENVEPVYRVQFQGLPTVYGQPEKLKILFKDLIDNSIKFRREGEISDIKITAKPASKGWLFTYRDNGIGIKPEHLEDVFSMFQKMHVNHKTIGTGIGLAHCKKIVELHNGRIWAEADKKGAIFKFTLPNTP